jgi:hypothetical protein
MAATQVNRKQAEKRSPFSRGMAVALGFSVFVGISLVAALVLGRSPSPQKACTERCAAIGKQGNLHYNGPATPKSTYKEAHSECQCK